jgi:hypothetical protein
MTDDPTTLTLEVWTGPWDPDDPDANYKAEVALYAHQDPMPTLRALGDATGIPVGAIVRYVLARYAAAGSGGIMEVGPSMIQRLWQPVAEAEERGTAEARLAAYESLRALISWLRLPLVEDGGY